MDSLSVDSSSLNDYTSSDNNEESTGDNKSTIPVIDIPEYYTELSDEAQKSQNNNMVLLDKYAIYDTNIYAIVSDYLDVFSKPRLNNYSICKYDSTSKESKKIVSFNNLIQSLTDPEIKTIIHNNNIYIHIGGFFGAANRTDPLYNSKGEKTGELHLTDYGNVTSGLELITSNDQVVFYAVNDKDFSTENTYSYDYFDIICQTKKTIYITDKNMKSPQKLPECITKDKHNLDKKSIIKGFGGEYNGKMLAYSYENELFYYDLNKKEWSASQITDTDEIIQAKDIKQIGKFILFDNVIFDIEKDSIIKINNPYDNQSFASSYAGGLYNYIVSDNKWYKVQLNEKDNNIDTSNELGEDKDIITNEKNYYPLTDVYYILSDDAGYFLRKYETGDAEEEIVFAFNQ